MMNSTTLYIDYTKFGETRRVLALKHNMRDDEIVYDEVLWVERSEDFYALSSPQLKNKRVVIVTRDDWMRAPPYRVDTGAGRDITEKLPMDDDRVRELESKYNELIMAVACKFPNETRHETALRYIKNAEVPAVAAIGQSMKGETE